MVAVVRAISLNASILCCLHAVLPIVIVHTYIKSSSNSLPQVPAAFLLFLSEAAKLLATLLIHLHVGQSPRAAVSGEDGPSFRRSSTFQLPWSCHGSSTSPCTAGGKRASALLALAAACYCVSNNLTFHLLQHLPAHSYALLSNLKPVAAGLVALWLAGQRLTARPAASLALMLGTVLAGHCAFKSQVPGLVPQPDAAGEIRDLQAAAGSVSSAGSSSAGSWLSDSLLMAAVSVLSAVASGVLVWIQRHTHGAAGSSKAGSSSRSSSSSMADNSRRSSSVGGTKPRCLPHDAHLYAWGALLNGGASLYAARGAAPSMMHGGLWLLVLLHAALGLATGNAVRSCKGATCSAAAASCSALITAVAGDTLLGTFSGTASIAAYIGCFICTLGALQLQRALQSSQRHSGKGDGTAATHAQPRHRSPDRASQQGGGVALLGASPAPAAAAAAAVVLLVWVLVACGTPSSSAAAPASMFRAAAGTANPVQLLQTVTVNPPATSAAAAWGPQTDVPMRVLPPFEPTCFTSSMDQNGCPVLDCRRDMTCSIHDPTCCAWINFQILQFFDAFMSHKCLQDEWLVLYGTSLGALRNQSILPHTEDLDIGLTPLGVQFLELNSTRQELWRHGYSFWHDFDRQVWKLCPHAGHPSAQLHAAMLHNETGAGWQQRTGRFVAGYMDAWMVWEVPDRVTTCTTPAGLNASQVLAVPWDTPAPPSSDSSSGGRTAVTSACRWQLPATRRLARASPEMMGQGPGVWDPDRLGLPYSGSKLPVVAARRKYCALEAAEPLLVQPGSRTASIGGLNFPMAVNAEAQMVATYGPDWRTPNTSYHGDSAFTWDEPMLRAALLQKLSVTAWGDVPYKQRVRRCSGGTQDQLSSRSSADAA